MLLLLLEEASGAISVITPEIKNTFYSSTSSGGKACSLRETLSKGSHNSDAVRQTWYRVVNCGGFGMCRLARLNCVSQNFRLCMIPVKVSQETFLHVIWRVEKKHSFCFSCLEWRVGYFCSS